MDNMFDNAFFGKAYKTRDGRKAILITYNQRKEWEPYVCAVSCYFDGSIKSVCHNFYPNGRLHNNIECVDDIVSEWVDAVDEKQLDDIAREEYYGPLCWPDEYHNGHYVMELVDAFKEGYRKGKGF